MSKVLRCRDVGTDCGFEARGETAEEILKKVSEHARKAHGFASFPPDLIARFQAAIREEEKGSCGTAPSCGCR
ncbi:MAG: DUF1059 domain-containing protein [Candidatus Omnitrophica bacterium]|nr:DUF1059 domain-containing protein [Candidatus Omnitrophota bacterium]